jgi:contractile injection system tube protein
MATDPPPLQKLQIEVYPDKKFEEGSRIGEPFNVLFNPSEYALARSNEYAKPRATGRSRPEASYVSGNPDQLTMTLLFDGTGVADGSGVAVKQGPVSEEVWRFLDLMRYQGEIHKPAYLQLRWGGSGGGLSFRGYLKSASATFTLFSRDGEPIRAKVNASFEEAMSANERLEQERRSSPDLRQLWEVGEGERLDLIADRAYGAPSFWREIARANGLRNPRSLVPGMVLVLPAKEG